MNNFNTTEERLEERFDDIEKKLAQINSRLLLLCKRLDADTNQTASQPSQSDMSVAKDLAQKALASGKLQSYDIQKILTSFNVIKLGDLTKKQNKMFRNKLEKINK